MLVKVIDPVPIIKELADRCLKAKGQECSILGELIDLLRAAPAVDATPKWIPSREKLPTIEDADKYQRVLVIEHGMIDLVNYRGPHNYPDKFPYWMPLSGPPKECE